MCRFTSSLSAVTSWQRGYVIGTLFASVCEKDLVAATLPESG